MRWKLPHGWNNRFLGLECPVLAGVTGKGVTSHNCDRLGVTVIDNRFVIFQRVTGDQDGSPQ